MPKVSKDVSLVWEMSESILNNIDFIVQVSSTNSSVRKIHLAEYWVNDYYPTWWFSKSELIITELTLDEQMFIKLIGWIITVN